MEASVQPRKEIIADPHSVQPTSLSESAQHFMYTNARCIPSWLKQLWLSECYFGWKIQGLNFWITLQLVFFVALIHEVTTVLPPFFATVQFLNLLLFFVSLPYYLMSSSHAQFAFSIFPSGAIWLHLQNAFQLSTNSSVGQTLFSSATAARVYGNIPSLSTCCPESIWSRPVIASRSFQVLGRKKTYLTKRWQREWSKGFSTHCIYFRFFDWPLPFLK
jgi:hypothetical protein